MITMDRLTEIANRIGTDKGTMDYGHRYTLFYHELLDELSKKHIKMLEIGVADPRFPGASLKMWNEYFPDIELIGYDINPDAKQFEKENVSVFIGDQNNPAHLEECVKTYGGDFDIIVDDGSHYGEHIVTSFKTLYPYLKEGGIYIIEDLHAAQLDEYKMIEDIKALNYESKQFYQTHHNKLLIIVK
jgi:SAM-dependent methyltransferase